MRDLFIAKWIRELNSEIEQAKILLNYFKLLELRRLREDLIELRDRADI